MLLRTRIVIFLAIVEIALCLIPNITNVNEPDNAVRRLETRRRGKKKKIRSTSSSEGGVVKKGGSTDADKESLELSTQESTTSSSEDVDKPKSSAERRGWRKWHRKCSPCPEDMTKKWRDPSIKWICGGYQRARRTFKSLCMMHYRNCQDGTMFVKINDHRCPNDTPRMPQPHGSHFFYDYKVDLTDDSTRSSSASSDTDESTD